MQYTSFRFESRTKFLTERYKIPFDSLTAYDDKRRRSNLRKDSFYPLP